MSCLKLYRLIVKKSLQNMLRYKCRIISVNLCDLCASVVVFTTEKRRTQEEHKVVSDIREKWTRSRQRITTDNKSNWIINFNDGTRKKIRRCIGRSWYLQRGRVRAGIKKNKALLPGRHSKWL